MIYTGMIQTFKHIKHEWHLIAAEHLIATLNASIDNIRWSKSII